MSYDSYYVRLMSKGVLSVELCDLILEFADDDVPVVCTKETAPLGWFCYSIKSKKMSEIKCEDELDICKRCKSWSPKCACDRSS